MNLKNELEKIQKENEKLKKYDRFFDALLKDEFGLSRKEINNRISTVTIPIYEQKIEEYFGLETDTDWDAFLDIICNENIVEYYQKMLASRG